MVFYHSWTAAYLPRKAGIFMALFGEYDIGALYKETISVCLEGVKLTPTERATLFAIVCLSEVTTGICYNPDTMRAAQQDDVYAYVAADYEGFCDAFARLARIELLHLWNDKGRMLITLNEYMRSSLHLMWNDNARPAMIITRREDDEHVFHHTRTRREGFVYIARAENGLHKIGRARDPERRVRGFAGAVMPFVIELIHKIPSNDAIQAEKLLHQRYSHCRRVGEWFDLDTCDVDDLREIRRLNF